MTHNLWEKVWWKNILFKNPVANHIIIHSVHINQVTWTSRKFSVLNPCRIGFLNLCENWKKMGYQSNYHSVFKYEIFKLLAPIWFEIVFKINNKHSLICSLIYDAFLFSIIDLNTKLLNFFFKNCFYSYERARWVDQRNRGPRSQKLTLDF